MGDQDNEINIKYIAGLCYHDWGLWRTTTMNLKKVGQLAKGYTQLTTEQKEKIDSQVKLAQRKIEQEPKSLAWRLRSRVGDRVKWYRDVDEVQ
jgi:hypothetical protein